MQQRWATFICTVVAALCFLVVLLAEDQWRHQQRAKLLVFILACFFAKWAWNLWRNEDES